MFGRRLKLDDGREIYVAYPGRHNTDAGPDFMGAKLDIDGVRWVGNVEMHVKASDWYRHGHDRDRAYDNVALHVVAIADGVVKRPDGSKIPQLTATFPESFFRLYGSLAEHISDVRCHAHIRWSWGINHECWLETLAIERIQVKARRIFNEVSMSDGDWERGCFITVARGLGFGLNSEPFEMLARSLPLSYIHRHSDDLFQLEALLFGQAGMLDMSNHIFDEYYQRLCREYIFLARKYNLRPMRRELWKYSKTRPGNFPHRRIAYLAKALYGGFSLLSKIVAAGSADELRRLFDWHLEGYWETHSAFDVEQCRSSNAMTNATLNLLLINVAAPIIYAYCASRGDYDGAERALDIWRELPPERNGIITRWQNLGVECTTAMRSQALLQLRKEYCDAERCLDCRIAHTLMKQQLHPEYL